MYKEKLTGSQPEIKAKLPHLQCPRKLRLFNSKSSQLHLDLQTHGCLIRLLPSVLLGKEEKFQLPFSFPWQLAERKLAVGSSCGCSTQCRISAACRHCGGASSGSLQNGLFCRVPQNIEDQSARFIPCHTTIVDPMGSHNFHLPSIEGREPLP